MMSLYRKLFVFEQLDSYIFNNNKYSCFTKCIERGLNIRKSNQSYVRNGRLTEQVDIYVRTRIRLPK